jgi:hypothetical protein
MEERVIFLINRSTETVSLCQVWVLRAQHVYRRAHGKGFSILFTRISERHAQMRGGYLCLKAYPDTTLRFWDADREGWVTGTFMQLLLHMV